MGTTDFDRTTRHPGHWYVGGTMAAFSGPPPFGWVQGIDVDDLIVVDMAAQQ
jgi:hypothetical protein